MIKSWYSTDKEILQAILALHVKQERFDLDPTFSKGIIYRGLKEPKLKFDISPQRIDTVQADCRHLPLGKNSISSILFDPPFMFNPHGRARDNKMRLRFSIFQTWDDLVRTYQESLSEFYRVLTPKGILVFKCQDYTDTKTTMTHCLVYRWAEELGYYAKDLFIKASTGGRLHNYKLQQKHARKLHAYYWVFERTRMNPVNH